ncbi:MAG: autotransporter-associated beta strand repeat protein, partial [Verrucomicrobiales bacterium]|nr:autotransporter-associated beta strand repeat protein [Verrucomicrobiales bacterium]
DTATDSDLPNGWRLNASARHIMWDAAPGAGPITFDNFSLTWKSGPRTWTGGGVDGNWSTSANWGGAVPGNGDFLTFAGATRTINTNDLSSLSVPWIKFNAGGFSINGNALTVSSAITNSAGNNTINAPVTSGGALRLQSDSGTLTGAGAVANGGQTLTADGSGNTTVSGIISGTGALTKTGGGTLQLSGTSANTYSGLTTVTSGTLLLAKTGGVNAVAGGLTIGDGVGGASADVVRLGAADQISTSAVTISGSGLLDLNGFNETIGSLSGSTGGLINLGAGTLNVGDGNSTTYAGSIAGTGGLIKTGSGTLTLKGASTFSGATAINSGVLNVQNATSLGAGAVSVSSGTALELQGGITISGQPLTINGSGISGNGALRNISGNNSWSGSVTLGTASTVQSDSGTLTISGGVSGGQPLTVDGLGNTTISGVVSGAGALTKNDAGTLTLNAANTYTGNTTINSGALTIGSSGSIASSPIVTIATGATLNTSSGFAIASSQTLARNATSGAASINGPVAFSSGASLSLPADGTGDTVSSVNVTGNLTLNNNTITVNVSGGALNAGSYSLLTYSGTRNGTFNLTPVITGSGIQAGTRAVIFITSGLVSLKVIAIETNSVFRVMTYNIHSGADPVTGNIDTTRTANFITGNDVDLVSLNEVARNMPRSNGRDIIAELSQKTGMPFVFSNNMQGLPAGQEFGNAILSRFPILFRDHRLLPNINGNEQRGWLKTIVDVNGKYITFESTHLDFHSDSTERLMCATNINTWLAEETVPTIICGDFNDTPSSPVYNLMDNDWKDTWTTAGDGSLGRTVPSPGYPNNLNARIDYIWKALGTSITPTNEFVGYTIEASDHYPVISDFILTSTTNYSSGFYFPFDEGSGTTVTDSVGGLQSDAGTPTWSTSSPSGHTGDDSLSFNGSKKISVPDPKQTIGPNPFNDDYTLQAWVKIAVNYAPSERAVLFQYERKPGFSFSINTNRTLHTSAFKIKDISSTATVPNDGAWHHVAVVHTDGVNMQFYIDGALAATVAYTNGAGYRTSSEITIGAASEGANWFTGNIDRIRFDNRVLTPSELDSVAGTAKSFMRTSITGTGSTSAATPIRTIRIVGAQTQSDGRLTLTWSSVGGTRYRVQSATSAAGPFTDIARDAASETDSAPAGQASTQSFTEFDNSTNAVRFYRIQVVP